MYDESIRDQIISTVFNYTLPPVAKLVEEYESIFGRRDKFLWMWIGVQAGHNAILR